MKQNEIIAWLKQSDDVQNPLEQSICHTENIGASPYKREKSLHIKNTKLPCVTGQEQESLAVELC